MSHVAKGTEYSKTYGRINKHNQKSDRCSQIHKQGNCEFVTINKYINSIQYGSLFLTQSNK